MQTIHALWACIFFRTSLFPSAYRSKNALKAEQNSERKELRYLESLVEEEAPAKKRQYRLSFPEF